VVLAGVVGGLLLGPAPAAAVVAATAGLLLSAAVGRAPVLAVAALATICAALGAHARLSALDRTALGPWIGHTARVRATVLEAPRRRSFGRLVALARLGEGPGRGERVLIRDRRGGGLGRAAIGAEVRLVGGWRALPDFEQAARRRGAHALIVAEQVEPTGRRRGGLLGAIDSVRRRADRALTTGLPPPLAALARGMVLGEDEALDDGMRADFRASGLAHLVAASGANVALLGALVLGLCALAGVPLRLRLALALVAIAGYVPLAGGGPSIQRAGVMGGAALIAALASRPASRWYVLLLAAAMTLAANPRAAGDPGWQLSFAAVVALLLLVPPIRVRLARRLPAGVSDAVAISLAASLGTAPLIAAHFGRVSLVGVPANVLVAPAVAPVTWLGALAALAGQVTPGAAAPLMTLAAWPLAFIAGVGHAAAHAPLAQAHFAASPAAVAVWWLGLVALAVPRVRRRVGVVARRPAALGITAVLLGAIALPAGSRPVAPPGLVVSALDVGQGDATLIQDRGAAILVDAGPPDGPILRRLRDAGVRRLDLLVVTHAQADHEGGVAAVLDSIPVGLVLDGRDGVRTPDGTRFATAAREHGVRLATPAAGDRVRAGPLVLDVVSPPAEDPALHAGEDPNQRAIVAELHDGGFSMLLTSDAESDVTAALPLEPVDVLKVAHHGSADPGLPDLLRRLRPEVALIEVGRNNVYGHPAPATVGDLRAVPEVFRTDRDGTVRLRVSGGRIAVSLHK
jgi:competence protein ComEC